MHWRFWRNCRGPRSVAMSDERNSSSSNGCLQECWYPSGCGMLPMDNENFTKMPGRAAMLGERNFSSSSGSLARNVSASLNSGALIGTSPGQHPVLQQTVADSTRNALAMVAHLQGCPAAPLCPVIATRHPAAACTSTLSSKVTQRTCHSTPGETPRCAKNVSASSRRSSGALIGTSPGQPSVNCLSARCTQKLGGVTNITQELPCGRPLCSGLRAGNQHAVLVK